MKQAIVVAALLCSCATAFAQNASSSVRAEPAKTTTSVPPSKGFTLEDGTPVRIRTNRTISSSDAHVGENIDFEVLEEVRVNNILVIPKGGMAFATVTEAQAKRRMARGGKLDINIHNVRMVSGKKAALRAVKEVKGGGHTGAMTGGIVATSLVFFPAAPFFLFMHGKDISIPKGTEVTAYINGDMKLDLARFQAAPSTSATVGGNTNVLSSTEQARVQVSSTPDGADIEVDGSFVGNTPSTIGVSAGEHKLSVKKSGFKPWERNISVSTGQVNVNAALEAEAK
jgi:PEGA domain